MTRWCPQCRTEYRDGITHCADCGTDLVGELPSLPRPARQAHPAVTGPFAPDEDVVELVTTTAPEAEVTAARLRSEGIDAVVFGVDPYSGYGTAFQNAQGARIMVRRGDLARAGSLVGPLGDEPPRPRSRWVRALALFILLLIVIPIATSFPWLFVALIVLGVAAVLTRSRLRRPSKALD